jgi:predicted nucleotidyltransferase component of viral defense system
MKKVRDTKSPDSVLKRLGQKCVPGQSVQNAQVLFVLERFLARVAQSRYRDRLVLKGGILLFLLTRRWNRPTEDLDFLALRIPGLSIDSVLTEILEMDLGDRLVFLSRQMTSEDIRENTGYPCRRFTVPFTFGTRYSSHIKLDLSFGDPITPRPDLIEISPLLTLDDFGGGLVMGYPVQTFLAEKVETLLVRGLATTRAKDLFDLWVISRTGLKLRLNEIAQALRATADHRASQVGRSESVLGMDASALQPSYGNDTNLRKIWDSYVGSRKLVTPLYAEVVSLVQDFIRPMVERALAEGSDAEWSPALNRWLG